MTVRGTAGAGSAPVRVSTPALALLTGFGPFGTDTYLPALPLVAAALGTSAVVAQLTITVFLAALAVGQLLVGPVSDALGRRRILIGGAAVLAAASVLCAVAPTGGLLVLARAVQGLAAGSGAAIGVAAVADRFDGPEAAARFGTLSAIRLIGPVVAPAIGGAILLVSDFRGVFAFMAGLAVLALLAGLLGVPETLPRERRHAGGVRHLLARIADLLGDRRFRAPVIVQCLATAGFFVYIGGSSFVLQQGLRISGSLYSVVFATDAAAMALASLGFRLLVRRAGAEALRRVGLVTSLSGAAALLVAEAATGAALPLAAVWALLAVAVTGNGFTIPATTVLAQEAGRRASGTAASLSGGLAFLVGALTTPLTGLLGVQTVPVLALAMTVLGAAALIASGLLGRGTADA